MKYLVTILILMFASPAFAGGNFSAFDGANEKIDEPAASQDTPVVEKKIDKPAVTQEMPVVEDEPEFKIDERLYHESMGSNNGYYAGGFYGEESHQAEVAFYEVTSGRSNFGFRQGFFVVNDQLVSSNLVSPFLFPFNRGGAFFSRGFGVNIGGFRFGSGFGFVNRGFAVRHR